MSSARMAAPSTRSTSGASRRLAYEIAKHAEGIDAVDRREGQTRPPVAELDRQLSLNESVLRTKVADRKSAKAPTPVGWITPHYVVRLASLNDDAAPIEETSWQETPPSPSSEI